MKAMLPLFFFAISITAVPAATLATNAVSPKNAICTRTYAHFFDKDVLDFRIVFGYKDARPARFVGDRYERAYFVEKLKKFGFHRIESDERLFRYEFTGLDGKKKTINLLVDASSVGPDDEQNRNDPYQKVKSEKASDLFLTGLRDADLVFYYGHSRDGGGPDFTPPKLLASSHTNYAWYQHHRPGLNAMLKALKAAPRDPKLLGLYSCVSDEHFAKALLDLKPDLALAVNHSLLYYNDAIDGMMETLSSLLTMKCQEDFRPTGTELIHFFK
jgi:hypothetical protein